jgi:hypothetical protein
VTATLLSPDVNLAGAQIVWEARGQEPQLASNLTFQAGVYGTQWVEAEVTWPDGRRASVATNFFATNGLPTVRVRTSAPVMKEGAAAQGQFTLEREGPTNQALTVRFGFSGSAAKWTDYRRPQGDMPEFLLLPAGATNSVLHLVPVNDSLVEGPESVVLTLAADPAYNVEDASSAVVTLLDDDIGIIRISVTDDGGLVLTWTSNEGKSYSVTSKQALSEPAWTLLSEAILATGPFTSWTNNSVFGLPMRFFRVLESP